MKIPIAKSKIFRCDVGPKTKWRGSQMSCKEGFQGIKHYHFSYGMVRCAPLPIFIHLQNSIQKCH